MGHVVPNSLSQSLLSIYTYIIYLPLEGLWVQLAYSVLYINTQQSDPSYSWKDAYDLWENSPIRATDVPIKALAVWKILDYETQQVAQFLHSQPITGSAPLGPAACQGWCFLLSTGGSGLSLLQKPKLSTLPLGLGIVGPGDVICVSNSLSDFITPPLRCLPVRCLHSKGTQLPVGHAMCLHSWNVKGSLTLNRYFSHVI